MLRLGTLVLGLTIAFLPRQSLAPYVPTPHDVVDRMLALAEVTRNDVVYDLGCGDGRIPIAAAAKYGARGVGIDIDPRRIEESRANAKAAGVEQLVEFRLEDVMTADVSRATVVTLYLLSSSNAKLRPMLQSQLESGRAHRVARLQHGRRLAGRQGRSVHQRARRRGDALSVEGRSEQIEPAS